MFRCVFYVLLAVTLLTSSKLLAQVLDDESQALDRVPVVFEPNRGQAPDNVRFLAHCSSYIIFLQNNDAQLVLPSTASDRHAAEVVTLHLIGANAEAIALGTEPLPGKSNYFLGKDSANWVSGIPQYSKVHFKSVYPGIDLNYYGNDGSLEHDFVLSPGSDPNAIRIAVDGARTISLDTWGNLSLETDAGLVRLKKPVMFQEINGRRRAVEGSFVLDGKGEFAFQVGDYDRSKQLIIDPVMSYSTLIGANNSTQVQGVAVDPDGNLLITGTTFATSYPVVNPFQATNKGTTNVFVTKLNAAGNVILYSTYIGSSGFDTGRAIAVDSSGSAYITGNIGASDFPTTLGSFMTTCPGICNTPFVSKFLGDGSLAFSTFMGGSNVAAWAIAVDSSGSAYITGSAASNDLPLVNPFQTTPAGGFAQKLDPTGSALEYSTYLGGGGDWGKGITVDNSGSAYVVGSTPATNFPLKNPIQSSLVGANAFITKFSPDGSSLVFSTYLGGGGDSATGVAVDPFGNVHVTGTSGSCQFPLSLNALSTDCNGPESFVVALDASGTKILFSTLLPSATSGIVVDAAGNSYVTGTTISTSLPLRHAIENGFSQVSTSTGFVTELDLTGKLVFSSYLGGMADGSQPTAIAIDSKNSIYVVGAAQGDYPLVHPIPSQTFQSTFDTFFVTKIAPANVPQFSLSPRVSPILTLQNVSSVPLTIDSIAASSNFIKEGDCGSSLAPGTGCHLILIGAGDGKTTGSVTIATNATTSPQTFTIQKSPTADSVGSIVSEFPTGLQFPTQLIGTSSAPQKFIISNTGVVAAGINNISIIQPAPFHETNNCPALLNPFTSCTVTVTYQASTVQDFGQLAIVHDPDQTRDTVFLGGTGSSSAIVSSTPSVQFGTQFVGGTPLARIVNLSNTTPYPATITGISTSPGFTQTNTCTAPLAPHVVCRVAVSYVPASNENAMGTLTASNLGPGGPQTVNLFGTGFIVSDLAASPSPLQVSALLGSTGSGTVTLTNTSNASMSVTSFTVSGAAFSQTNNCPAVLPASSSCTMTVSFTPTQVDGPQTFNGSVSIQHSGLGSPQVVPVVASANSRFSVNPSLLDFGQQKLNTSKIGFLVMSSNFGGPNITVKSITVEGAGFKLAKDGCPSVFPADLGCGDLEISFTPSKIGLNTGTVTVLASDSPIAHTASLQGTGISNGEGTLSLTNVNFGTLNVGTQSTAHLVILKNTGTGILTISKIGTSSQFLQTSTCTTLAVGGVCTISVQFAPTLQGILDGSLSVEDDGAGSPHTVSLSGIGLITGSGSQVVLNLSMQALTRDSSGNYTASLAIFNAGTASAGNVKVTSSSLNAVAAMSLPTAIQTIAPGSNATVTLTFPSTSGSSGAVVGLRITGTYTVGSPAVTGNWGGTIRVTLP